LVLKHGQIAEQGSFRELIQIEDGVFASMWADQATSSDDPLANGSIRKRVSGYSVGTSGANDDLISKGAPEKIIAEDINLEQEQAEALPITKDESMQVDEPESIEPAAFPATEFAFPTSAEPTVEPISVLGPSVTFGSSVNSPPSRTGTPDIDADPKHKRISSQNFQRLARRLSLTTRRQGSSSSIIPGIPGLGKRDSTPKVSNEGGESSTARNSTETPADSLKGDDKTKILKRKDKKSRKGSIG